MISTTIESDIDCVKDYPTRITVLDNGTLNSQVTPLIKPLPLILKKNGFNYTQVFKGKKE